MSRGAGEILVQVFPHPLCLIPKDKIIYLLSNDYRHIIQFSMTFPENLGVLILIN